MSGQQGGAAEGVPLLTLTISGNATQLRPVAFDADETISKPFEVNVEMVSTTAAIDPDTILYKPACLTMTRQNSGARKFNGIVKSFIGAGTPVRGHWLYHATIVPRLWFMTQTADCRIFQQMTVPAILQDRAAEVSQTVNVLASGPATREYLTQYNETDFDFLQRLLEQEGYFYYFVHSDGDHVLTLCNQNQGFPASPKPSLYVVHEGGTPSTLTHWRKPRATTHGSVKVLDYDPTAPSTLPTGNSNTTLGTSGGATRDVFRWPARRFTAGDAGDRATFEMEAAEAEVSLYEAAGENHLFSAGSRFTIAVDPWDSSANKEYVIKRVTHAARDDSWVTGGGPLPVYENQITAFPYATQWRQPIRTEKPLLPGIYGALVVGDSGEEIHADQYGRIKVRLFFDHRADTTADHGVWARIVQPWAGNTWGWQHLPRVGTEVAVSFMDGDPDRPVVVGGLYNANMMPVFAVPAKQNISGFRSRSTKEGGTANFTEWSIDDTKGSELLYSHAEKDMTDEVENDHVTHVMHDQTNTIDNNRETTITNGHEKLTVSTGDMTTTVSKGNHPARRARRGAGRGARGFARLAAARVNPGLIAASVPALQAAQRSADE